MNNTQYELYHEVKEHSPLDFPYNTYLCSIPLDFKSVNIHWHDDVEIIVIKKGEGIISVDLVPYNVNAGDIIFIFSGQLHSIEQKDNLSMEYENILFKPVLLKSSGPDLCNDNFLKPLFSGRIKIHPVIKQDKIRMLIDEIDKLCDNKPYGYQLIVKSNLLNIIFELVHNFSDTQVTNANAKALEKMKSIITYVAEHYEQNITIEDIADHCYYSKSHFMKFFKENMGIGFIQYLNDYRLELAAAKLLESGDNILDIASDVGFDNLSYFNRVFKKKYGVTPGQYRKNMT